MYVPPQPQLLLSLEVKELEPKSPKALTQRYSPLVTDSSSLHLLDVCTTAAPAALEP